MVFMLCLSFSYIVNDLQKNDIQVQTYNYLGESVKFTGNKVMLGFGKYSFPVFWSIYTINSKGSTLDATPYSSSHSMNLINNTTFSSYHYRRVCNPLENAAVLTQSGHNIRMSEIYPFGNGCINSYLSFKNTGNRTETFEVDFSIMSNPDVNAMTDGFNYNSYSFSNPSGNTYLIPSSDMHAQTGNVTVSWYGEQSIFHGGLIRMQSNGNTISLPFGPITLSPNSSYSIDPLISPSPLKYWHPPTGCTKDELPTISNFANVTSPYTGPGESYVFRGYVNMNGKINGVYPSTYVGYEEKGMNSKIWDAFGGKTINSNGCVEVSIPYSNLVYAQYVRMVAYNIFGMGKDSKVISVATAFNPPVNRTIEIFNSTGYVVGAYNMAMGPYGDTKVHYNFTYRNTQLPFCVDIGDQNFATTVSYLNSAESKYYFFCSPDNLVQNVYGRDNYTQNQNPLLINGYSWFSGSSTPSNNGINYMKQIINWGFTALEMGLTYSSPEVSLIVDIVSNIIQYLANNYFKQSGSISNGEGSYVSNISIPYSYNLAYSNSAQRDRHYWGINSGTDYIQNSPNVPNINFTAYILYSVSLTLPGFIREPTDCGKYQMIPFSIYSSYTIMSYFKVSFNE